MRFALTETINSPGKHCFFGYYDRTQSIDGENFVCIVTKDEYTKGAVQIYNRQTQKFRNVFETSAISFQLGNLTSWVNRDHLVCHLKSDNNISAVIVDVNNGKITRQYDRAIYTVNQTQFAIMFHVENAGRDRPAYGLGAGAFKYRGITVRDLISDTVIAELSEKLIDQTFGSEHKLYPEHAVFLNQNEAVILFRSSLTQTGYKKEYLCIYNFRNGSISKIPEFNKISHFNCGDGNLIAFGSQSKIAKFTYIKNLVKKIPLLDWLRRNKTFRNNVISEQYWFKSHKWNSVDFKNDGHPTPFKGGFIFDTYEDKNNIRHLHFFDANKNLLFKIDSLPSDKRTDSTPKRCDLHPRAYVNGFTIDSKKSNYRECLIYEYQ